MPRIVFLFFFLSGFSALIYEVSWVRQLSLTLGNTAAATSTVLALFLGGLAAGAYLGGKQADKTKLPLIQLYGYLEIGVGITAVVASEILKHSDVLYIALYQFFPTNNTWLAAIRLILAGGLLLVPTLLMGATLPALVRYLEQLNQSSKMFSLLYGINTLGAASGGLAACFLGFAYIGLTGTVLCAAAINLVIGGFLVYATKNPNLFQMIAPVPIVDTEPSSSNDSSSIDDARSVHLPMLCLIACLTGITALSYEVLWTRILRFFLTSVTYSFTIMISVFLLGLAIGSLAYEQWILKTGSAQRRPYLSFAIVQYVAAAICAISLPLILVTVNINVLLHQIGLRPDWVLYSQPAYQILYIMLVSLLTILPSAIAIGILFPMIGTLAAGRHGSAATSVGLVYAFNTVGCVIGSLACGFFLMPLMGSYRAFQIIVVLSTVTGSLAVLYAEHLKHWRRLLLAAAPLALAAVYLSVINITLHNAAGRVTLATGEDYTGSMIVFSEPKYESIQLMLNGSSLASTTPPARRYMRTLGHLPVLLHNNPENVLVACFGTGTTCGAVSLHPEVKHIDVVELSKMVLGVAPLFQDTNYNVLKSPKVKVNVNDVRNFLLSTAQQYDVISFEPPPPSDAGIVSLYTEEFYELAAKHLKHDGIMCQWIPMDQESLKLWKMMIATARTAFPYVSVWMPNTKQGVLIASKEPVKIDLANIQRRIDACTEVKQSLDDVGLGSAAALLSTYLFSDAPLDEFIKDTPSITDNYPSLEFFMPYAGPIGKELEVEAVGLRQLSRLAGANKHTKGFSEQEFIKNWQAVHLIRKLEATNSTVESDRYIDFALRLVPDSKWLNYVKSHKEIFYKGPGE